MTSDKDMGLIGGIPIVLIRQAPREFATPEMVKALSEEVMRLAVRCVGYEGSANWSISKLANVLNIEPGGKALEFFATAAAEEIENLKGDIARIEQWQKEGEGIMSAPGPGGLFSLGAWWADRPWRRGK